MIRFASSWLVFSRLGRSWTSLGAVLGRLGSPWARLGALLARPGCVLAPSWPRLGAQGGVRPGLAWNGNRDKGSKVLQSSRKNYENS